MDKSTLNDLTLRCSTCKNLFVLPSALGHKKQHRAMRLMRYKEGKGPRNLESLTKRHMMLMHKLLAKYKDASTDPSLSRRIEKINNAYETLRFEFTKDDFNLRSLLLQDGMTSMRDGYFEPRDKILQDQVNSEAISTANQSGFPSCICGIGQSQAINTAWRDVMEDATIVTSSLPGFHPQKEKDICFVGMFDGHHGTTASHSCAGRMCDIISQQFLSFRNNIRTRDKNLLSTEIEDETTSDLMLSDFDIATCLTKSYLKMDEYLSHGINESSKLRWSGCSALTCFVVDNDCFGSTDGKGDGDEPQEGKTASDKTFCKKGTIGKLYVSNAGNVRAVLYHKKKSHVLSELHTLENADEQKRVIDAGGAIINSERLARVYGILNTSRGLGNHGDHRLKECVISSPHITTTSITHETQMLVIATNSVWDVLSPSDVFSVLIHSIPSDVATVFRSGPKPVGTVIHGNFRGKKPGVNGGEGMHVPSTLPSIVETEEEQEIEEVIFVQAQDSDSDDDKVDLPQGHIDDAIVVNSADDVDIALSAKCALEKKETSGEDVDGYRIEVEETRSTHDELTDNDLALGAGDYFRQDAQKKHVASVLSDQLVRAAICAGAVENISVVVILFQGMFLV